MFASLFRTQKSASTSRCGSPRRARLGVESLEDRTVPSTMVSNLGLAGDGAHLFGGLAGGVINQRAEQVSISASRIGRMGNIGEEIPSLMGGNGGVSGGDVVRIAGGAMGGVTSDAVDAALDDASLLGGNAGASGGDVVRITGGAMGGVTADAVDAGLDDASLFGATRGTGEEIPA